MSIEHEYTINPITALQFFQTDVNTLLLLAGEGIYLKIYNVTTSNVVTKIKVFRDQVIHGIAVQEFLKDTDSVCVAVWGGDYLTLLLKKRFDQLLKVDESNIENIATSVSDWILCASISPFHPGTCALITAHNAILTAHYLQEANHICLESISLPTRSVLYSAHLVWESQSNIFVASGTVFGEIIVWRCFLDRRIQAYSTFSGHEGSIYGVEISPRFTFSDGRVGRLLVSCSDDRTIRVWDLSNDLTNVTSSSKETGFGPKDLKASGLTQGQLAIVMSHASRIWGVRFLSRKTEASWQIINILSFGEDATTQQWDFKLDPKPPRCVGKSPNLSMTLMPDLDAYKLFHIKTYAFHSGKHIWSSSLYQFSERFHLATGGADGKISLYDVEVENSPDRLLSTQPPRNNTSSKPSDTLSWSLVDILSSLGPSNDETSEKSPPSISVEFTAQTGKRMIKNSINRYAFISENELFITTLDGRVILATIGINISWNELFLPDAISQDIKSYAVVKGFAKTGRVYFTGTNGIIYAYHSLSNIVTIGSVKGKVSDMFIIHSERHSRYGLLVTELHCKVATYFYLDPDSYDSSGTSAVGLPEKFVVTSAGVANGLLILGSRSGSIAIYQFEQLQIPFEICKEVCESADAITTILPLESSDSGSDLKYFLTTSRNGVYFIFLINSNQEPHQHSSLIKAVHRGSPPFGPMIENAWFQGEDLFLSGFKSKNFVVWNETRQREIMSTNCGGGHRSYAYSPSDRNGGGQFVYTKASKLHIYSHTNPSHRTLKQECHGREIKACAISQDNKLIATGAEDTIIRIWCLDSRIAQEFYLKGLAVVQKHSAGIQHLQWVGSRYLFSGGGNEEMFVWAIQEIPNLGIGIICEASYPKFSEEKNLRIMHFDVTFLPGVESDNFLFVCLAFSDSTIRIYRYSKQDGFILIAHGKYTSSCITQIRKIKASTTEIYFLTTATDGVLAIWNASIIETGSPHTLKLLSANKLHQNTVKSLDFHFFENRIVVLTGGDDNALGISIYDSNKIEKKPCLSLLTSAHAAAITGLSIIPTISNKCLQALTTSNDQRIKVWTLKTLRDIYEKMSIEVELKQDVFTSIADASDLVLIPKGTDFKVLVVGNGLEIWSIS